MGSSLEISTEKDKALISFTSSHQIYFSNYFIPSGAAEYYQSPLGDSAQKGNNAKVLTSRHAGVNELLSFWVNVSMKPKFLEIWVSAEEAQWYFSW